MSSRNRERVHRSRSPKRETKYTTKHEGPSRSPDSSGRKRGEESRQRERYKERRRDNASNNHRDVDKPEEDKKRRKVGKEEFLGETNEETASQSKDQPNFALSGKLTEYTNTYKGVVIKYNEPPEALKPKTRWRLYPFKDDQALSVMYIHRQSAYLIGRQRHIVDLAVDHPSCSKQHAVLQYRLVNYEREDGSTGRKCKPYILDLESANGTFLNNQKIEARRYYELKEKDVLKFGFSTREYVLLNEKTKGTESDIEDDDNEETKD